MVRQTNPPRTSHDRTTHPTHPTHPNPRDTVDVQAPQRNNAHVSAYFTPWIAARVMLSVCALGLVLRGAAFAWAHRFSDKNDEASLRNERRAELLATLVSFGVIAETLAFVVHLMGVDGLSHQISGAMCAEGVLDSTRSGSSSLVLCFVSAVFCGVWLVFHRQELGRRNPHFTQHKYTALLLLAPVLLLDLGMFLRFLSELDMSAHATCCSVSVAGISAPREHSSSPSFLAVTLFIASFLGLTVSTHFRTRAFGVLSATTTLVALASLFVITTNVVAPHVYETPVHTCPYCLLHEPYGWALLLATLISATSALGIASVQLIMGRAAETAALKLLARTTVISWTTTALLIAFPVLLYAFRTGQLLF